MKRLLILVTVSLATAAHAQTTLTFRQALQRAVEVNNTVERAHADVGVAEANKQLLLSNVLPRITATGSATRNSEEISFGSGSDKSTVLPRND